MAHPSITQQLYDAKQSREEKQRAFLNGEVPVAVYGLGKMGLPLAAVLAEVSGNVRGVDIDPNVVDIVADGRVHFDHEPGLERLVAGTVERGALRPTTESKSAAAEAAIHVIIVPTEITDDHDPDLTILRAVIHDIASGLDIGDLVIVESTVPPGTCRNVITPLLESESGLEVGDFGVAFCPERTKSGRALKDIRGSYPKVVGGIDDESTRAATTIYRELTENDVIPVSDATTAEAVKVFEGVYRDVNIALANELARFADEVGIDILEAIDVANGIKYVNIHDPGAGVGGHCIPYYPYFLIKGFDTPSDLMETARKINDSMPYFMVEKLTVGLDEMQKEVAGATIIVLGVTYLPGIPETRHSPAGPLVSRLHEMGANVFVVDPVNNDFSAFLGATAIDLEEIYDVNPDAFALVTAHEEFRTIDWDQFDPLVIVDGRDAIHDVSANHWRYTIGKGWN